MIFRVMKKLMPPLAQQLINHVSSKYFAGGFYSGPYATWEYAEKCSAGYEFSNILNHSLLAHNQSLSNGIGFQRDGVWIKNQDYSYPCMAYLIKALFLTRDDLHVIDFGGGLASTYFQLSQFLGDTNCQKKLTWSVVEQFHFVEAAMNLIFPENVSFYTSIEQIPERSNQVLLLSGVLQYLQNPLEVIRSLINGGSIKMLLIDRVPCIQNDIDLVMVQHTPKIFYEASYPCWMFSEKKLLNFFTGLGRIEDSFSSIEGLVYTLKRDINFRGFVVDLSSIAIANENANIACKASQMMVRYPSL